MRITRSGDYTLPSRWACRLGNVALHIADFVPSWMLATVVRGHSSYQVSTTTAVDNFQGISDHKLEALALPPSLHGKSVIDLGCSEGFFCRACARRGASSVVGVDSSLGRLLYGMHAASQDGVDVKYTMDVFPSSRIRGSYDYVLCLSLLHHCLSTSNVWKVLVSEELSDDRARLRDQLKFLRTLTATSGTCIVEMPYEYDNPETERQVVDFDRFADEMKAVGFSAVECVGSWDYNPAHRQYKDRIIYLARA